MYSQVLNKVSNGLFVELSDIVSISNIMFKGTKILGLTIELKNGNKLFVKDNDEEKICDVRDELIREKFENDNSECYKNAVPINMEQVERLIDEETSIQYNTKLDGLKLFKWGNFIFHKENDKVNLDILLD